MLGNGNVTTITTTPTSSNTLTIPALSANDTFVLGNVSQVLTNKTLTDNTTRLQDDGDNTKKLAFEISNVSGSSTVTLTAPNQSGTIAVGASTPLSLNTTTGVISCATCLTTTSSNFVSSVNAVGGAVTIVGGGINGVTTVGQTITVTGTEADTLTSVTTRNATTSNAITLSNAIPLTLSDTNPTISLGTGTSDVFSIKDAGNKQLNDLNR